MTPGLNKRSNKIYSRIVIIFLILTIMAIGLVLHFALAKATIKIQGYQEERPANVLLEIQPEGTGSSPEAIFGKILNTSFEAEVIQEVSQTKVAGQRAAGYVTIYNNYSKNQTLVKTTRLLTPDNKLYRLTETVQVPSGSQVTVWAEADQEGEQYLSAPAKFIIPGLWEGLRDKIYGQSEEAMQMQSIPKYIITPADIDQAQEKLAVAAQEQSLNAFNQMLSDNLQITAANLSLKYENGDATPLLGQETREFKYQKKVTAYGLVFNQEELVRAAQEKFKNSLSNNETLSSADTSNLNYNVVELDVAKGRAVLDVQFNAKVSGNNGLANIDKNRLAGRSISQAQDYLQNELKINEAQITLWPFWVQTIPTFQDHIIIE